MAAHSRTLPTNPQCPCFSRNLLARLPTGVTQSAHREKEQPAISIPAGQSPEMSLQHVCRLFQGVPCQTHAAAIDTSARKHVYSSPSAPFLLTKKMKFTDLRTNSCMTEGQTGNTVLFCFLSEQGKVDTRC